MNLWEGLRSQQRFRSRRAKPQLGWGGGGKEEGRRGTWGRQRGQLLVGSWRLGTVGAPNCTPQG